MLCSFAREGARVVVNDLGGARDGGGVVDASAAEKVVQEIRAAGGEATANHDDVATTEGAQAIVKSRGRCVRPRRRRS